ncbi:MAG TPA: L-serine ammonia-lyase [Xanthobacteraceae bacterium]|nr:MAG: L-serine ammonia-lyase [Rhizobiales bacterium 39-66-18]HQS10436.1 L-serine ammonia-lyase [Xanthobacteraceae bacterium]HQS45025.1 L-serine ammonia-lyase [Xanthobacteraceae bacterium]
MISVFDLFKIGIGPSSSHTVGPMVAARRFRDALPADAYRVSAEVFGSLAWTGKGHASDQAICLGLMGTVPAALDPDDVPALVARLAIEKAISTDAGGRVAFDPDADLIFDFETLLPLHSNAMRFRAFDGDGAVVSEKVFYSIGGGFVVEEGENLAADEHAVPYPFDSAADLLTACARGGLSMAEVQMANECARRPRAEVDAGLDAIAEAMFACIDRGLSVDGSLPGRLRVKRRAKAIREKLEADHLRNQRPPHEIMDWVSVFAIAVNEENAAGGRVVTAPTNGAAGIVPAVLRYARDFCPGVTQEHLRAFLLTAAAVGALIKRNASISGAEVGCQGEVGSAASMAAAGLACVLGATPEQIENAAEIAMEHHLGMTCDPIGGLVQIPCIERNAFGANKAIAAASLALRGDGIHHVSLDQVIETMRQTGADMQSKYKETSQGGLAVNVPEC